MSRAEFGIGVYTPTEAARMVGMESSTLRRWLRGYAHHGKRESPLWLPQHSTEQDDELLLGFRDLIEARIIHALREKRIGLPTIRICLERAREIVGDERPFSTRQFKTDGRTIFLEIIHGIDEPEFIDLKRKQGVFKRIVEPSLEDLDFGERGAERWWLLPKRRTIVADPTMSFGQPIIADYGITTASVLDAVNAEGSVDKVSRVYDIPIRLIRDALRYETGISNSQYA